jgi:hypothetical protein
MVYAGHDAWDTIKTAWWFNHGTRYDGCPYPIRMRVLSAIGAALAVIVMMGAVWLVWAHTIS